MTATPKTAGRNCINRTLVVGVVGLGVGEQHARTLASLPGCELTWLCDFDVERAGQLAREIPTARVTSRFGDILEDNDVNVVSIASYDDDHFDQVMAALPRHKHIFVEKPLCGSMAELEAVKAAWLAADRPRLDSNLILRAAPLWQWLRDAVRRGEFGRIYSMDAEYLYGRLEKITNDWRKDVKDYSVMRGGGIHMADLMISISGELPTAVSAAGNRICTDGSAFRYDDFIAATYRFPSGLIGRLVANFGCVHQHQHVIRLYGTRATFLYDDLGARVYRSRDPGEKAECIDLDPLSAGKGELLPKFVKAIQSGSDTAEIAQHNFDVISICVAADESIKSQHEVAINYV